MTNKNYLPEPFFRNRAMTVVKWPKTLAGAVLLFLTGLGGCDPVRRIDMVNRTADTVQFTWKLNEDNLMFNPFLLSNSKELTFTLAPPKTPSIKMSFGEGNWTPREVQKLVGFLTALEIKSSAQKMRLDSLPLLKEFLLARRKGIGGARIEIVVTDSGQGNNRRPSGKKTTLLFAHFLGEACLSS